MKTIQQSPSSAPEAVARVLVKQLSALFLPAARVPLNDPVGSLGHCREMAVPVDSEQSYGWLARPALGSQLSLENGKL